MATKKKSRQLTIQDGFDKKTGKFNAEILKEMYPDARYYFILGGRGWGKTYPVLRLSLKDALNNDGAFAYVRRYKESIGDSYIQDLMGPQNSWLEEFTSGDVNKIGYWRKRWFAELWGDHTDRDGNTEYRRIERFQPALGGAFSMNTWETSKGPDFGADKNGVKNIIIDEVLSAGGDYLPDEWNKFQNVISSLVRENWDKDTKIWLLANPVSKYNSPYFRNLGIKKSMMKDPGIIEIKYPKDQFGKQMSCIFCYLGTDKDDEKKKKPDAKDLTFSTFFAFPSSVSKSITHGEWELAESSHLPSGVLQNSDEIFQTFFVMEEEVIGCKIMRFCPTNRYYLFYYPASKVKSGCYYFTLNTDLNSNAIIGTKTGHPLATKLNEIMRTGQVYYADNTTADMVHGWLLEASKRII